jgi:flavin reductase (DIM6/NTAB) family NADH-FMN oxidoreductase RutF
MLVAVYKNTQTFQNCTLGKTVLLQLLTKDLAPVVRVCGQLSGQKIDKISRLKKRYDLDQHKNLFYFKAAAGFMELIIDQLIETSGDHVLLVGKVSKAKNLVDEPILTTTYLKEHGYTR